METCGGGNTEPGCWGVDSGEGWCWRGILKNPGPKGGVGPRRRAAPPPLKLLEEVRSEGLGGFAL